MGTEDPDAEFLAQNTENGGADGTGDNSNGIDDENLTLPDMFRGRSAVMTVPVSGPGAYLQAWIDYDLNGTFDTAEQIALNLQDGGAGDLDGAANGAIQFSFTIPSTATTNPTFARFRWSTQLDLNAFGDAPDGEIEDYGGITIKTATVITNRRITYRVKSN